DDRDDPPVMLAPRRPSLAANLTRARPRPRRRRGAGRPRRGLRDEAPLAPHVAARGFAPAVPPARTASAASAARAARRSVVKLRQSGRQARPSDSATPRQTTSPRQTFAPSASAGSERTAFSTPCSAMRSTKGSVVLVSAKVEVRGTAPGMLVTP